MEEIKQKYTKADIKDLKFKTAEQVKKVLGFNCRTIRGFKNLSKNEQELAESLFCKYLNGLGLEARETVRPTNIISEPQNGRFKVRFKKLGFSYLYFNGTVG